MKTHNKGQTRIIEAFLAVFIIFSSFAISANLTFNQNTIKCDDLAHIGLQALMKLDSDGSLSNYIDDGNWSALRDALNLILPTGICFNVTIYDDQLQQINSEIISNGGFSSQRIAFVEYIYASRRRTFRCYIIHLNLAMAE
ncbi:MAG: hypothetical protein QXZ25_01340 [Candidatus Bathyarchaeia archaeon]